MAAKELTALILNEERLRAERSDRKSWKSRVTGLEEYAPQQAEQSQRRPRERRAPATEEEDAEYRLAIEASKYQEEEDKRMRQGRVEVTDDDDLAKAIKLSQEEEERRRRELEETNASSLFDDDIPRTTQPQPTGLNHGYQQGNPVDFFANPIEQPGMQNQPTGYMTNAYTGFQQPQQTGWQPNYNSGIGTDNYLSVPMGNNQQQQQLANQQQLLQQQQFAQLQLQQQQQQQQLQLQSPLPSEPALQPGSNNPWATTSNQQNQQSLKPTPTGSNNPFAQFNRPQSARPTTSSLGSLPEQKTLSTFNQPPQQNAVTFSQPQQSFNPPQKELSEHEIKLNALLASGDGMDTYGNTGDLRIPAQHTAPGTFVNSAGAGLQRLNQEATGNNPFLRQQFTGMPSLTYGGQPSNPPGLAGSGSNNPFGGQQRTQQQGQGHDLIQF